LNIVTDEQILATADPALMFDKRLQLAHDRMLLLPDPPQTEEYGKAWREYLAAGGDRSMRDKGIDLENWWCHREISPNANRGADIHGGFTNTQGG